MVSKLSVPTKPAETDPFAKNSDMSSSDHYRDWHNEKNMCAS